MKSRLFYASSTLLIGMAICVSVWFFLHERKAEELHNQEESERIIQKVRNGITTDHRNSSHREENEESSAKRITQRIRSSIRSRYSEKELADPEIQKRLAVYDSPGFLDFMKDVHSTELTERKWNDFLESQGLPVKREYPEMFRHYFPTGEPEDYEPEMRLKFARMFIAQAPVDLTNPLAAAGQRRKVILEFLKKSDADIVWYVGQFGDDWDTAGHIKREGEPRSSAREWLTDVQRNAASIVANVEAAEALEIDTAPSASSWDLSSVMESTSASHSEMAVPTTLDTSESAPMTNAEIRAEIESSLTPQPPDIPTAPSPDKLGEIQSNLEASLKLQFSSERFERAMETLEQYGPEEGLRRLRENDPEVAKQVERHRNRSRSLDSNKSEEEVSQ